ncbi:hypothetical protein IAT40_004208 [Kwoniella sp. CBS 6097]
MRLSTLVATLGVANAAILPRFEELARRQSSPSSSPDVRSGYTVTEVVTSVFRNGPQDSSGSSESTIPFPCSDGCWTVAGTYFFCYVNTTQPNGNVSDPDQCNEYLCNPAAYNQLFQCLNCIVANGGERPFGYHTNTSLTVEPTHSGALSWTENPNGLIDLEQSNAILKNVTERCESVGKAINEVVTTVTATATTTGPYYTSWTTSATLDMPKWTGLTQYTSGLVQTLTATIPIETGASSSGTANTAAASAESSSPASGGNSGAVILRAGNGASAISIGWIAWMLYNWI